MSNLDVEIDNLLDDDSINEILKETEEKQYQDIQEQYDKGIILDYSNKKTKSIFNDNEKGSKLISKKEDQDKHNDDKPTYPINKYSQGIPLAESILVNNIPYFIQIFDGKPIYKQKIELSDIDIVPPERTEYLSKEYNFNSFEEVQYFINLAKQETLDSLETRVKTILQKYIDIDDDFINILAADIIFTYFQDRLKMTHYLLIVGDNNTGKSNILLVFSFLGYRPVLDTAITPANIYNFGSHLEDGQCIILEDEIDDIDDQADKKKFYKSSYRAGTKVTRMYDNNNSGPITSKSKRKSSRQNGFFLFGFKMFASEKLPDKIKSKGFLERIIPLKAVPGDPPFDISEVVDDSGDEKFNELFEELMITRKLLLMYRLLHHNDTIPNIKLNIKNRYKQLTKPVIRLFQNTKSVNDITKSLSKYLIEKNEEKIDSMDSAILTFIVNLVAKYGEILYNDQIWNELKTKYPNGEVQDRPYSWYIEGYGSVSKNSITKISESKFGAKLHRDPVNGRGLIFNQKILSKLVVNYSIINGIEIVREENEKMTEKDEEKKQKQESSSYDIYDTNDTSTEYTDKDSNDNITENVNNMTEITQNQEWLIPKNDNIITKNVSDLDTKTNEHSQKVSYPSQVSYNTTKQEQATTIIPKSPIHHCHYCNYSDTDEKEVERHSVISHHGKPARPDAEMLKIINNKVDEKEEQNVS
jgi:hypothetical protein